ncbi:MAG: hypothetical protein V4632_02585 [Pseudomonadota bacterium]
MMTMTVTFDLTLLYFVGVNFLAILIYVFILKHRSRSEARNIRRVSNAITDYFLKSGVAVSVSSHRLADKKSYTAFIESEPMKRFRLSHIVEMTLNDHVQRTCGLELDKVYWRFPVKAVKQEGAQEGSPKKVEDDYINEGLLNLKDLSTYEVEDSSYETFEHVSGQRKADAEK